MKLEIELTDAEATALKAMVRNPLTESEDYAAMTVREKVFRRLSEPKEFRPLAPLENLEADFKAAINLATGQQ